MATKPVRFLVISDTHDLTLTDDNTRPFRLSSAMSSQPDVVLHCGDITNNGSLESYIKAIAMLDSLNAELKLLIAGNHDIDLDPAFWDLEGGSPADREAALQYLTSEELKSRGIHYLHEGTYDFKLRNGAQFSIYASPYTPQYGDSAFQYPTCEDRYNTKSSLPYAINVATATSSIPQGVDIIMTHGPPKYILDKRSDNNSAGCEHLRQAVCRTKPLLHCFGHIHSSYGAQRILWTGAEEGDYAADHGSDLQDDNQMQLLSPEFVGKNGARRKGYSRISPGNEEQLLKGKQTLMLNAAIGNKHGAPENAPWLVELMLSCDQGERT